MARKSTAAKASVAAKADPTASPARGRGRGQVTDNLSRRDGVTTAERSRPFTDDPALWEMEERASDGAPAQLALFVPGATGELTPLLGGLPALETGSSLAIARSWYRRELEQENRPRNTIESYCYDLNVLEETIGHKAINTINRHDMARYLGEANGRSTRKRRLTSARRFFRYLIDDARVLDTDPTDGYYPHVIPLRSPIPLFAAEQEALLAAAADDEPWSLAAIWLMMRLGLTRGELLALRRDHIDFANSEQPVVFIFYDDVAKRGKERKLGADAEFAAIYAEFLETVAPVDRLFTHGPPAVNVMVDRVREAAGIQKEVTPKTLRHSYAVDRALAGADEDDLITLLGLADDPRNRASVQRYLKLAAPPL